jgi:hypothetical protein
MSRLQRLYLSIVLVVAFLVRATAQQQVQPPAVGAETESVHIVVGPRTTGLYHRKGCAWLQNAATLTFTLTEARNRYFQAHCLCMTGKEGVPPCEPAATPAPAPAMALPAVPPVTAPASAATPVTVPTTTERSTATRQQCAATTKKGTRCSRLAQPGRAYCWQHP